MSLPWVADERRRQATLVKAVADLSPDDRSKVGEFPPPLREDQSGFVSVVGWWLKAGHMLGGVSKEGRDNLESRVGAVPSRGQYPPLWLAAHRQALHFPPPELPAALAGLDLWKGGSDAIDDYLWRLLSRVSDLNRPRFVQGDSAGRDGRRGWISWGWKKAAADSVEERLTEVDRDADPLVWIDVLEQEFLDLPNHASRLFGPSIVLEAGAPLSSETVAEWLPFWLDSKYTIDRIRCVRPPIVEAVGDVRVKLRGVAVLPEPGFLMRRVAQAATKVEAETHAAFPPFASVSKALRTVAEQFKDVGRPSVPLLQTLQRGSDGSVQMRVFEALMPLLRLLVSASAATNGDDGGAAEAAGLRAMFHDLRLALALDGFELRPVKTPSPGGDRVIPFRGRAAQTALPVAFAWKAAGVDVPVGVFGEPASCDESLLAAVETVDWRLWALKTAPWNVLEKKAAASLVESFSRAGWESIKRQALRAADDSGTLGAVFAFTHCRRLDLEYARRSAGAAVAEALKLDTFITACRDVEQLCFARLVAKDAGGPGRLDVPRFATTGVIDVVQWFTRKQRGDHVSPEWRVEWVPDARPVGEVIDESRAEMGYVVRVSAGSITAADLAILGLEPVAQGAHEREAIDGLAATLSRFQAAIAAEFAKRAQAVDVKPAIDALRGVLAGERAAAFHDLVERWKSGDESVGAWLRTLAADARFRFACHPRIDLGSKAVAPAAATDPYLEWAFDDRVPVGEDVAVTFALEPGRARRVISRGPRAAGSAADLADAVLEAAGTAVQLAELAAAARGAGDRWVQFPGVAPHPASAAKRLLDALLEDRAAAADVRAGIFAAARRWCGALGHEVVPATWSPDRPVTPEDVGAQELPREFHPDASPGSVIVRGFGLTGASGAPFSGAVSAGPAPAGFGGLVDVVKGLADAGPGWAVVAQRMDDLAKHALAGTLRLAASNLYDAFWEAAAGDATADVLGRIESGKSALLGFVKASADLVPFEPSGLGDYPTGWIRESDGKQLRGRRIRQTVRPGLRTLDNSLVRPALVITE